MQNYKLLIYANGILIIKKQTQSVQREKIKKLNVFCNDKCRILCHPHLLNGIYQSWNGLCCRDKTLNPFH